LSPQGFDVDDVDPARGDRTRHVDQDPAAVMDRPEPRPGKDCRYRLRQTGAVGEHPHRGHSDHAHTPSPLVLTRRSADHPVT
jgi:hypothetical protein